MSLGIDKVVELTDRVEDLEKSLERLLRDLKGKERVTPTSRRLEEIKGLLTKRG